MSYGGNQSQLKVSLLDDPAYYCAACSPSDSVLAPQDSRKNFPHALYVGGAGDVNIVLVGNQAGTEENNGSEAPVLLKAVPVGTVIRGMIAKVYNTSTTATHLVYLY